MKKFMILLFTLLVSVQTGYCANPALEKLQTLGDMNSISVPAPHLPAGKTAALNDLAGSTPFEKLQSLYNGGVPATKEDLTGYHVGRHVSRDTPYVFRAAILVGKGMPFSDEGPLFTSPVFKVLVRGDVRPDYFDVLTDYEILGLQSLEMPWNISFPEAIGLPAKGAGAGIMQFRKANGYIVERFTQITDLVHLESYSYYFLDVTPK